MAALLRGVGTMVRSWPHCGWAVVGVLVLLAGCVPDAPPSGSAPVQPPAALFGANVGPSETAEGAPAARVYFLMPGSPAETAGVREGDQILTVAGHPVTTGEELLAVMRQSKPDEMVPVVLMRGEEHVELKAKLGRRPPEAEYARAWRDFANQRSAQELAAAAEAERAGDHGAALAHGAQAARAAFESSSVAAANEALAQIGATLQAARASPPVPPEAERRNQRALAILRNASADSDNDRAAAEFGAAIYAAPWLADLYLNRGLVLARAGFPQAAATSLRQYLLLNPHAADAASVRGKIAELEVASEDQTPWLAFVSDWSVQQGGTIRMSLRGHTLTAYVLTPQPDTDQKPGDRICWGTVHGMRFEGRCTFWFSTDAAKTCFGSKREYEADGGITGNELQLDTITNLNFNTATCAINTETRGHRIWLRKRGAS